MNNNIMTELCFSLPKQNISINYIDVNKALPNYDDIEFIQNEYCYLCGVDRNVNFDTYLNNLCVKTCLLCNVVANFKIYHIGKTMLCYSSLSQLDIIRKTTEYYNKNKSIPLPKEIDNNVKFVNITTIAFAQFISSLQSFEKTKLNNYVYFFTGEIDNLIPKPPKKLFGKSNDKPYIAYDMRYFEMEHHTFVSKLYDEYIEKCESINKKMVVSL